MPRIDAHLAPQVADTVRPRQSAEVIRETAEAQKINAHDLAQSGEVEPPDNEKMLEAAAAQVKQVLEAATGKRFAYQLRVDDQTGSVVAQFRNESGEVIRQLPSEEILKLRERLQNLVGMFLDETV